MSLLLLSVGLVYMALMCAFVTSNYHDKSLERTTAEMLTAANLKLTSYGCAIFTVANLSYVAFCVYFNSQAWPKLFVIAFVIQSISKLVLAVALSPMAKDLYFQAVDYLVFAQLAIAYSQCLICIEMLQMDSFRKSSNAWLLIVFMMSSCLNMFAVYGRMIGLPSAESCMLPFYVVMYFIASRWIVVRWSSKTDNGLIVTANIDIMWMVFILPNMSHLTPRLILLYVNSQSLCLGNTESWFVSLQLIATTVVYFVASVAYRYIVCIRISAEC